MIIRLEGVLYKTDPWIADLFTDILNATVSATSPAEINRMLLHLCLPGRGPDLHKYFRWGFDKEKFWLQQCVTPDLDRLYPHKLLTVMAYNSKDSLPQTN